MNTKLSRLLIILVVLVLGSIFTIASVKDDRRLLDVDEAAWTFDGYFLDLYAAGDWDVMKWREFDKYAQHPPAVKYLFGALHHAIGEPVKSMEPRRFWYENDLDIIHFKDRVLKGLYQRVTYRQIMAGRYMAAGFAVIAAILFFFLARRFGGTAAALIGYALFILHPMFRDIVTIATADSFLLLLCMLSLLLAVACARRWSWAAVLAAVLGIAFASKLITFAWVIPVGLTAALCARGKRSIIISLCAVAGAVVVGFVIMYILDPGLQGEPFAQIMERIAWRTDRIEIQQIVFSSQRLTAYFDRFCFLVGHTFFSSRIDVVFLVPLFALGLTAPFFKRLGWAEPRERFLVLLLAVYFVALTFYALPMAWTRYVTACLPFFVLLGVQGAALLIGAVREWSSLSRGIRACVLSTLLIASVMSAVTKHDLGPRFCQVPRKPPPEDVFISKIFAYSLMHPGQSEEIHRHLYKHFLEQGDSKRAAFQKKQLEKMQK